MPLRLRHRAKPPPTREARLADVDLAPLDDVTGLWPGRFVDLNGRRVHVRDTPAITDAAQPALFVHGLAGSSGNWTDVAGLLRRRLAITSIDLPGFGLSEPPARDDYSLRAHAGTVISYLQRFSGAPVHLVSNSMGGAVSILVAARRPDLVRTLTLISPAVPDNALRVHPLRYDWRLGLIVMPFLGGASLRQLAKIPVEARVRATVRMIFADPSRLPERRYREMVEDARARLSVPWAERAVLRSTRALMVSQTLENRHGWSSLRQIKAPTLVLWGDTDRLVAADLAPYVAAAIPDARLKVFENVGHTAMIEDPVSTARAIVALVDDVAEREAATRT